MDGVLYLGPWNFDLLGYIRRIAVLLRGTSRTHPIIVFAVCSGRLASASYPQFAVYLQGKRLAGTKDRNCPQSS
jgi:hypothetical protein